MVNSKGMRYLAASTLLNRSFRQKIIDFVESERCAMAPEIDIDLGRLAKLSYLLQNRDKRYNNFYLLVVVIAGILTISEPILGLIVVIIGGWIVNFRKNYDLYHNLVPYVEKKSQNLDGLEQFLESRYSSKSFARKIPDDSQNVVVYSGFSPFIGAGTPLGGWSFPIDISKPREEWGQVLEILPFKLAELYDAIEQAMHNCGFADFGTRELLLISGQRIRDERWILPSIYSNPIDYVNEERMKVYAESRDSLARYYKWMYIRDIDSEIIISYFLRFSLAGSNLFVELNSFLLTPYNRSHRQIDGLLPPTRAKNISSFFGSGFVGPFAAIFGALSVVGDLLIAMNDIDLFGRKERAKQKEIEEDLFYDYGAKSTLREDVSGATYDHYFQLLDKEMYTKLFSMQLLNALQGFLEAHNINSSDIKERQTTILNSGLIVQGGDIKAESLAVGTGARSSVGDS